MVIQVLLLLFSRSASKIRERRRQTLRILLHWIVILSKFERETKITHPLEQNSIIMRHCSVVAGAVSEDIVSEGIVSEVLSEGSVSEVLPEGLVSEVVSEGSASEVVPR